VKPHQCLVQGHNNFPAPAGHTIPDTSQDAIGLLGHLDTLLAHVQLAVDQHPQILFLQAAFQSLWSKTVELHGIVVTKVQDLALGLTETHTIGLLPSIHSVQIPLQTLLTLQQLNTATQLGVTCKLTEGALNPLIQKFCKQALDCWKPILHPMPPTGVSAWALKSNSYGDMTHPKELSHRTGLISVTAS